MILGRAAAVGVVGGAVLGALVIALTAAIEGSGEGMAVAVVFAAAVGAITGLIAAVPSSTVWILLVDRDPPAPRAARGAAALTAASAVVIISALSTHSVGWFAAGCAVVAGLTAHLLGPWLGYRRTPRARG